MEVQRVQKPFLTARWTHLAMLNYEVDPAVLAPLVPRGAMLDEHGGQTFCSMVGFQFYDARLRGWALPGHRHFEEVNLRFYVRDPCGEAVRRGVVFVKEIVPRRAVALVARFCYDENFDFRHMQHRICPRPENPQVPGSVEYQWRHSREWQNLRLQTAGQAALPSAGSFEEFILDHYWAYSARRDGSTSEYLVEHPPWKLWQAADAKLHCDVERIYGKAFLKSLSANPVSAFLADGSAVAVYPGTRISG
jgi:uncharacterized protein YqjF (DUF2071 family)